MPEPSVGSPEWWLRRLNRKLDQRQTRLKKLDDYYYGRHPLLFATPKFLEVFGDMLKPLAVNFVSLVIDAVEERLTIQGFRVAGGPSADERAAAMWQANGLDARSQQAHREALIKGECSISVWSGGRNGQPKIRVEDARQVVVETDPEDASIRRAALKRWGDDTNTYCTLYLPDRIFKYQQPRTLVETSSGENQDVSADLGTFGGSWRRRLVTGEAWPLANPLGRVPIVPMVNRPRLDGSGESEMERVLSLQDAANKLACDMIVASEFAAFRQRWATGVDIPVNPVTGEPIEDFDAAVDRLLHVSAPDARFGEFGATELENYVKGMDAITRQMASISHTPQHYLIGSVTNLPSGEAQTSAESGLVSKVRDHQVEKGEVWEEVIRLGGAVLDNAIDSDAVIETIWADAERHSPSEFADSLTKESSLNVPDEILWAKLGYTPEQIATMKRIRRQELAELAAAATDPSSPLFDPDAFAQRTESFSQLQRGGVLPEDAAAAVGLDGLRHTGERPVTTRPLES